MPLINYTLSKSHSFKSTIRKTSIVANENEEVREGESSSTSSSSSSSSLLDMDVEKALSLDDCSENDRHIYYNTGLEMEKTSQESSCATSLSEESIRSSSSSNDDELNNENNVDKHSTPVRKSILKKETSSSSSSTTTSNKRTKKERVQFGNLQMRFYNRILGDNPACQTGPPLELDWSYNKTNIFNTSIDDYETHRLPRRTRRQLVMTTITRRNMMIYHFGCTHEEIDRAANGIKKIQRQRERTKSISPAVERRQEMKENLTKMLFGRRNSKSSSSIGRKSRSSWNRDDLMTVSQRRSVEAYEDNHLNQLLMVR